MRRSAVSFSSWRRARAVVIFVGALLAFVQFIAVGLRQRNADAFVLVRLRLGRFLALGLEFQLVSNISRTAVSPSLQELGTLASIRTALNFFLAQEIREERAEIEREPS